MKPQYRCGSCGPEEEVSQSKVWLESRTLGPESQSRTGLLLESTETLPSSLQTHPAENQAGPWARLGLRTHCLVPLMIRTEAPF